MDAKEAFIFYTVILFSMAEYLWEVYLDLRQYKVYKSYIKFPTQLSNILTAETFEKARLYGMDKIKHNLVFGTFSFVCNLTYLWAYGMLKFWNFGGRIARDFNIDNELVQSVLFMFLLNIFTSLVSLPGSIYFTFVLEEKHGFNKQTFTFFIADKIKKHILIQMIVIPVTLGIVYIVKVGGQYFFIYLWVFVTAFVLFLYTIYPDYIAPRFDKYTLLPEGELKTEIEKLASKVEFPLSKIYIVEGSKRSAHSNAFFYGLFKQKRIVLFDTLLKDPVPENSTDKSDQKELDKEKKGCDTNEILAVLSHELGHWKYGHVSKNLFVSELNLFIVFVAFGALFWYKPFYSAFGYNNSQPIIIGLIIILHYISLPYFEILNFMVAHMNRKFENEADLFAKSLGYGKHLKNALIKLNDDNLGFPIYDHLYSKWHHTHPPLLDRIKVLDKID